MLQSIQTPLQTARGGSPPKGDDDDDDNTSIPSCLPSRLLAVGTGNPSLKEPFQLHWRWELNLGARQGRAGSGLSSHPVDDNLTGILFPTIILLFLISAL